jgi:sigma-70-like protein
VEKFSAGRSRRRGCIFANPGAAGTPQKTPCTSGSTGTTLFNMSEHASFGESGAPLAPAARKPSQYRSARFGASMSFTEIGAVLGVSHQRAEQIYSSGMKKLRAQPEVLARLMVLAASLAAAREVREYGDPALRAAVPRTVRRLGASDEFYERQTEDLPSIRGRFAPDPPPELASGENPAVQKESS